MKELEIIEHVRRNRWGDDFVFMEKSGRAMGRVYVYHDEPEVAYIEGFSVSEKDRHKGLGRAMFDVLMRKCRELKAKECMLWCYTDGWVIEWYERMGFSFFSEYPDENNAVWLKKEL